MNEKLEIYDITIIGGGPVGLFTAFYAGMRQATVKIIESLPQLGGQLSTLYPEKFIYDIAGFPKITAQSLVDGLIEQMNQFEVEQCLGEEVQVVEKLKDGVFMIRTNSQIHYSRSIIITAGNGAFQPRTMKLPNEAQYIDKNIHYFVDNMEKFAGKEVVLFGGGDSAVDWALMLEPIAKKVTLVHRRNTFRAHEHSVELLKNSKVEIITPYAPVELIGEGRIEKVIIQKTKSDEYMELVADDVLVNYGFISSLGPIKDWQLDIEKNSLVVNSKMETNIPGIYAVGDINTYEGKVKLIATGFGEAPIAVSEAKMYIDPNAKKQTVHSTSLMETIKTKVTV